jgi:hypothetical protein
MLNAAATISICFAIPASSRNSQAVGRIRSGSSAEIAGTAGILAEQGVECDGIKPPWSCDLKSSTGKAQRACPPESFLANCRAAEAFERGIRRPAIELRDKPEPMSFTIGEGFTEWWRLISASWERFLRLATRGCRVRGACIPHPQVRPDVILSEVGAISVTLHVPICVGVLG